MKNISGRLIMLFLLIAFASSFAQNSNKTNVFGRKDEHINNFRGLIYFLPRHTKQLPEFLKLKPVGEIYTECLNVPNTDFKEGFPGVTKRYENFGIDYFGEFYIKKDTRITFTICSDDGSKLFIDNWKLIDNNYEHEFLCRSNYIDLKKGVHTIEVQYYQGPKYKVGLVLSYKEENDKKYKVFNLADFSQIAVNEKEIEVEKADVDEKVKEKTKVIEISISSEILFEFDSYSLSELAHKTLSDIKRLIIDKNKIKSITISGHTDDTGSDDYNMKLSLKRAESVQDYFKSINVNPDILTTKGFGETQPKFPNTTEEDRKKNRRIEILIEKM